MATDIYIDPSLGSGGSGTEPDPYGDLSLALSSGQVAASDTTFYFKCGTTQDLDAFATGTQVDINGKTGIIFKSYDTGARPIINGLTDVRTETWTAAATTPGTNGGGPTTDVYTMPYGTYATSGMSDASDGDTYRRERVFYNKVGLVQATDEYFVANGVDATCPIYWDGTYCYYYHVGGNPSADGTLIESLEERYFIRLNNGNDVTIQDIDIHGTRIIAETITSSITSIVFDNFRHYYACMGKSPISIRVSSSLVKIKGFKFINGSILDRSLTAGEEPRDAATPTNNTSFGSSNGIDLRDNIGDATGGTLGDSVTISDFTMTGFGHTFIQCLSTSDPAKQIAMRNILVENGLIQGGNSNHARGWAIGEHPVNADNVVRNIRLYQTRSASKIAGLRNAYYNIIGDSSLEDLSRNRSVAWGGVLGFDNWNGDTKGDVIQDCRVFNITFVNCENAPFLYDTGAVKNSSGNIVENVLFVDCGTSTTDTSTNGTCVYELGSNYTNSQTITWRNIRAYNSNEPTPSPVFHIIRSDGVGTDYTAATFTSTFSNVTDVVDSDPVIDASWIPGTGGSAYNAGATVTITGVDTDYDYYNNPRPGAGASNTAYDIGAVEYQDDSAAPVTAGTFSYSLRRKIAV
jgi:hypothetical protein